MLWGGSNGGLELRRSADGATRLRGRFPYGVATLLQGGPDRRREVFEARAFGASVADGGDIHLLVGHDFDKPLASRAAGSLILTDDAEALTFEADLSPELRAVSYVADFLGTLAAGLVKGVSPGFRVPAGGDLVKRDGEGLMRVVRSADLVEISVVTKPAYPAAQIEARNWQPGGGSHTKLHPLNRWRL
ncbi:HK97 family phage prohead protease [Fertoebacter nigrum]|uniref:HK97 family phage prohead protease n=1 Tax=Fertoeibacter niger TaxID=2656921 RepID=A0A8X8GWT2_9RHOB|nr:HK97 family phage prohead protease [Fertoeibacter niger]NUB42866.1 HK97 family phage prohead protease [Fertoeibacter niger]